MRYATGTIEKAIYCSYLLANIKNMGINYNPSSLRKKSILRDTNGQIINWLDEANGGWIIRNRQVVNQARYDQEVQK